MANTLTAQFAPSASMRITDPVLYVQIAAQYGFGTNIIFGVAPQTLATTYGINWVNNPTTADYNNLPCVFTLDTQSKVLGTSISTAANGVQTLTGQDYTDPNGQHFTDVTWEWQVEVQLFNVATSQTVFSQQVITYTGDGLANRLVPTTIDLSQGVTAIWIFGNNSGRAPVLATSAMIAAGKFATYSVYPASTVFGVTSLGATGFTVNTDATVDINRLSIIYTAIVWNDSAGTKMQVGSYTGNFVSDPLSVNKVGTGLPGLTSMLIVTGGLQGSNADGIFAESDHGPGVIAFNIADNESLPLTGEILGLSVGMFTVGPTFITNGNGHTFYWVAFALASDDPIRTTMMNTWTKVGTGSADVVSGFGFNPGFAFARTYEFSSFGASWRSPSDTGTNAHSSNLGTVQTSGGIEAFGTGSLTLGSTVSPNGVTVYGFALAASPAPATAVVAPTWVFTDPVDLGDGTTANIETTQVSQTSPGDGWVNAGPNPATGWWCQLAFGLSVFQIDSPGPGWVSCSGPVSDNGWYLSTARFGNQDTIVSGGRPADPRPWAKLSAWCTVGNMNVYGGSPSALANINNRMVYPASGYVVGTDYPPIRIFDGRADKELCKLPPTTANVAPKAVLSMLTANGTVYLTSWDSGTSSADWNGRVFQLDPTTGVMVPLGLVFANGELPYALEWHMGRLWCGTNNGIGTVGKVYFFRPGIDTAWTLDHATSADSAGGVTAMASYKGKLYVGTDNAAGSRGKVLVRDTAGAYTTSQSGAGGTAVVNNGYLALTVLGDNLYASYWNNDTMPISIIEKFTGSAWTTVYTGVDLTLRPFILLQLDNEEVYAVGGAQPYDAALLVTSNGTSWTDLTLELPEETATLLPMFGAVVA